MSITLYHWSESPPEIILKEGLIGLESGVIFCSSDPNLFSDYGTYCYSFELYEYEFEYSEDSEVEAGVKGTIPAHMIKLYKIKNKE